MKYRTEYNKTDPLTGGSIMLDYLEGYASALDCFPDLDAPVAPVLSVEAAIRRDFDSVQADLVRVMQQEGLLVVEGSPLRVEKTDDK